MTVALAIARRRRRRAASQYRTRWCRRLVPTLEQRCGGPGNKLRSSTHAAHVRAYTSGKYLSGFDLLDGRCQHGNLQFFLICKIMGDYLHYLWHADASSSGGADHTSKSGPILQQHLNLLDYAPAAGRAQDGMSASASRRGVRQGSDFVGTGGKAQISLQRTTPQGSTFQLFSSGRSRAGRVKFPCVNGRPFNYPT